MNKTLSITLCTLSIALTHITSFAQISNQNSQPLNQSSQEAQTFQPGAPLINNLGGNAPQYQSQQPMPQQQPQAQPQAAQNRVLAPVDAQRIKTIIEECSAQQQQSSGNQQASLQAMEACLAQRGLNRPVDPRK